VEAARSVDPGEPDADASYRPFCRASMSNELIALFGVVVCALLVLIAWPRLQLGRASRPHPAFDPTAQSVTTIFDRGARNPRLQPILRGSELAQQYKGRDPVLTNAQIELYPGDMVCIVGLNGRGKSTLLKMLALDEKPRHGEITIDGMSAWNQSGRGAPICAPAGFPSFTRRRTVSG